MTIHNNQNPQSRLRVRSHDPQAFLLQALTKPDREPTDEEERIERERVHELHCFLLTMIRRVVDILFGDGNTAMYALARRGESLREIAQDFDCSHETVRRKLGEMKRLLDHL